MKESLVEPGTCYGCGKNLRVPKSKFEWLVSRGYDPKDAAAQVLHNPTSTVPPRQCCIVGLQTNIDPDKEELERDLLKAEIQADRAEALRAAGLPARVREEVKIYAADATHNLAGYFILRDAPFDDPALLAPIPGQPQSGFAITDITPIPGVLAKDLGWGEQKPLILRSGQIKIIPVLPAGNLLLPGFIWVQSGTGQADKVLDSKDKSFLQADITEYNITNLIVNKVNPITGATVQSEIPFQVIRLRKQFPEDIIA
jgi:hypothetical protein